MKKNQNGVINVDAKKTDRVALSVFFKIATTWGLSAEEQRVLLGCPTLCELERWRVGHTSSFSVDSLKRVSYVVGIYKSLGMIFPNRKQADSWLSRSNASFGGSTAIEFMLVGSKNMKEVLFYLRSQASSFA